MKEDNNLHQTDTAQQEESQQVAPENVVAEDTVEATIEAEATEENTVAALQAELDQMNDRLLRKVAEFENFRKRTLKEKTELILNGGQKVIESLLPVLDDLERAQDNMSKTDDIATLREGVDLIISKLTKCLSAHGLVKMDTTNAAFDTDFHEAIALVPATQEEQKNCIIDCVQAGYLLNEKVIRHAKVVVGQ